MKKLKIGLRIWIASVATVGFLAGWGMFAHANTPAPLFNLPSISASVQANDNAQTNASNASILQSLPQQPQVSSLSRLRTGGS
jgi:hypothetical protein